MAAPRFENGLRVGSTFTIEPSTTVTGLGRTNLAEESLSHFAIPWTAWRVWDAIQTNLPGTAAADDLELKGNTFGTGSPSIETGDVKTLNSTRYARCQLTVPYNYSGGDIALRFRAQMVTTVADTSCTLDAELYRSDEAAGIGSDLVTTAATSINSLTDADYDFTVSTGSLSAGDLLDLRIAIAYNDSASGTAVIGQVGAAWLLVDTKG